MAIWPLTRFQSRASDVVSYNSVLSLGGPEVLSRVSVTETTASALPAYHCGVSQIQYSIAGCVWQVMRNTGSDSDRGRALAEDHPLFRTLNVQPNDRMDAFQYKALVMRDLLYKGWHLSYPEYDENNRVISLKPMNLDIVQIIPPTLNQQSLNRAEYHYRYPDSTGRMRDYPESRLWKVLGLTRDGVTGVSPIRNFAQTLGINIAAERQSANFFGRGGRLMGLLTSMRPMISQEETDRVADTFAKARQKGKGSGVAVLTGGWSYEPIEMNPAESQLFETKTFGVREVARMLQIPPTKLMDMEYGTYSNAETEALAFVKDTLTPWSRRLESASLRQLLGGSRRYFVEVDMESLSRGDLLHTMRALRVALGQQGQLPILTIDEIRRIISYGQMPEEDMAVMLEWLEKIKNNANSNENNGSPGGDNPS